MKKILYLCTMMLLSFNGIGQINGDFNWSQTPVFYDNFNTSGRIWDDQFIDQPIRKWHSYYYGTGVTHGWAEHQAFQRTQCHFDINSGTIKLASDYTSYTPMTCDDFEIPNVIWLDCDDQYLIDNNLRLFYYSGAIETNRYFRYGYFEMRCKLPIHKGAFPAFWLFCGADSIDPHYEEIDIFEFSWYLYDKPENPLHHTLHPTRMFTNGSLFANNANGIGNSCGRRYIKVPSNTALDSWNTFGCEWSPNRIVYYLNGEAVNEYYSTDSVPHRPMTLIANYALDEYSVIHLNNGTGPSIPCPEYFPDTMYIDYIKVNQLKCDCDENVVLTDNQDVSNFDYGVKKTISFVPDNGISISSGRRMVFRATDGILINPGVEVQQGRELELIIHPCPDYNVREEEIESYKNRKIITQ